MNKKNIKVYGIAFALLILYIVEVKLIGFSIPCAFYTVTGLKCPGCGITRMGFSLLRLDFKSAFGYNPFVFVTSPLLLYLFLKNMLSDCGVIKSKLNRVDNIILYIYIALFIVYGIVRNIFIQIP